VLVEYIHATFCEDKNLLYTRVLLLHLLTGSICGI